jgi:hypothetical protein
LPFYRCFIRGENFPGECIGKTGPHGFYTTRWLEAVDENAAELCAVEMLRREECFAFPPDIPKPTETRVFVEEILQIKRLPRFRGGGATWFSEVEGDDDDEPPLAGD